MPNNIKSKISLLLLLFLLISVPLTVYVIKQYQEYQTLRSQAAAPSQLSLTTKVPNQTDRLKTINGFLIKSAQEVPGLPLTLQTAETLRSLANERKNIMLSYLPHDPD